MSDDAEEAYPAIVHRLANYPERSPEHQRALAELQVQLVKDQIRSAERVSDAADATGRSLSRATWVLSIATAVLAVATVVLVVVTAIKHGS